jgi:hypothetical protein
LAGGGGGDDGGPIPVRQSDIPKLVAEKEDETEIFLCGAVILFTVAGRQQWEEKLANV